MKIMIKWLKKNGLFLVLGIFAVVVIASNVVGYIQNYNYKKNIKGLGQDIVFLKQDLKKEADKTRAANRRAEEAIEGARLDRVDRDKYKARIVVVEREKQGLREKIANLPPTTIVVRIIEYLEVEPHDIVLQEQGVLFTLIATRRCLEELEGFSLVKKQYGDMQLALAKSEAGELKLQNAIVQKDIALASQKKQIDGWSAIELKWEGKFDLSEKRNKKAFGRGRKQGTVIGAVIVTVLWIFLGK